MIIPWSDPALSLYWPPALHAPSLVHETTDS